MLKLVSKFPLANIVIQGEQEETMSHQRQDSGNGTPPSEETEYVSRPTRRTYSKAYKRRIVKEAAACGYGETGALLRRKGLYSSQLTDWRRQAAKGELDDAHPTKRGRKKNAQADELSKLQKENARLTRKLEQAELIIDAQKKLALALEQTLTESKDKS